MKSPMINFEISESDKPYLEVILDRADQKGLFFFDRKSSSMDLRACHANDCPLDFKRFSEADDFNFLHDFCGIFQNINRETGKLMNHFEPRFARKKQGG